MICKSFKHIIQFSRNKLKNKNIHYYLYTATPVALRRNIMELDIKDIEMPYKKIHHFCNIKFNFCCNGPNTS